jgi:hypothetical protein
VLPGVHSCVATTTRCKSRVERFSPMGTAHHVADEVRDPIAYCGCFLEEARLT